MDTLRQDGNRNFKLLFYSFITCLFFYTIGVIDFIIVELTNSTISVLLPSQVHKMLVFFILLGYLLLLLHFLFALIYYWFTKTKIYKFRIIMILSVLFLFVLPLLIGLACIGENPRRISR